MSAGLQSDHDDPEESGTQRGSSGLGDAVRAVGRALRGGDRHEKTGRCVCVCFKCTFCSTFCKVHKLFDDTICNHFVILHYIVVGIMQVLLWKPRGNVFNVVYT